MTSTVLETSPALDNIPFASTDATIPEANTQHELFQLWLRSITEPRKSYKIPPRITSLPCGCGRERGNESDPNNTWHAVRKKTELFHRDCMRSIGNFI